MAKRNQKTAFAALTVAVVDGQREYVLIPDGEFRSVDGSGRPAECSAWRNSAEIAARVIARVQSRHALMTVDYEHQTLLKEKNGQPAPRSGSIDRSTLRYESGVGIIGEITWMPRAAAMIASGEYAYLSPVFHYDKTTGEVLSLLHVALTNDPGLDDLPVAALMADFDLSTQETVVNETLKKLLAKLGLPDDASEEDALSAVGALIDKSKVAAMSADPDPAKFVAVETMRDLQAQVAALSAAAVSGKAEKMVDDALAVGKLLPAQRAWAISLGNANIAQLSAYIESTPAIAALLGTQTQGVDVGKVNGEGKSIAEAALSFQTSQAAKGINISTVQAVAHVTK